MLVKYVADSENKTKKIYKILVCDRINYEPFFKVGKSYTYLRKCKANLATEK
jgi:hypothetical protein